VLSVSGTIAIHLILIVFSDAVTVYNPYRPPPPAPRIEMIDIEVPAIVTPPPPPIVAPVLPEPETKKVEPPKVVARTQVRVQTRSVEPPPETQPEVTNPNPNPDPTAGGDQVVTLDSAPPGATGVGVGVGKRTSEHVGRGGHGGGTGAGLGSGASPAVVPVSIANIKTQAVPKGDPGYIKDYPVEAQRLGIEGVIKVRLVVDAQGKVTSATLISRLGYGLDELALRRAKTIEFEPARDTDNHPVASQLTWTFYMTLPK
jgi:protein TonB